MMGVDAEGCAAGTMQGRGQVGGGGGSFCPILLPVPTLHNFVSGNKCVFTLHQLENLILLDSGQGPGGDGGGNSSQRTRRWQRQVRLAPRRLLACCAPVAAAAAVALTEHHVA